MPSVSTSLLIPLSRVSRYLALVCCTKEVTKSVHHLLRRGGKMVGRGQVKLPPDGSLVSIYSVPALLSVSLSASSSRRLFLVVHSPLLFWDCRIRGASQLWPRTSQLVSLDVFFDAAISDGHVVLRLLIAQARRATLLLTACNFQCLQHVSHVVEGVQT